MIFIVTSPPPTLMVKIDLVEVYSKFVCSTYTLTWFESPILANQSAYEQSLIHRSTTHQA